MAAQGKFPAALIAVLVVVVMVLLFLLPMLAGSDVDSLWL